MKSFPSQCSNIMIICNLHAIKLGYVYLLHWIQVSFLYNYNLLYFLSVGIYLRAKLENVFSSTLLCIAILVLTRSNGAAIYIQILQLIQIGKEDFHFLASNLSNEKVQ